MNRSKSRSLRFVILALFLCLVVACESSEKSGATTVPETPTNSEPTARIDQTAELRPTDPVATDSSEPAEEVSSLDEQGSGDLPFNVNDMDPAAAEHFQSAMVYFDDNQFDLGRKELNQAIEIEPDFAWAYAMRFITHMQTATADSEKAYALDPDLFQNLSFNDLRIMQTVMELPIAEGLNPTAVEHFINARKLVESGDWDFSEGDQGDQLRDNIEHIQWSLVFEELDQAISLEPQFINAYLMRSVISSLLSIFDYQKAIELDPTIPDVIDSLFNRIIDELDVNDGQGVGE